MGDHHLVINADRVAPFGSGQKVSDNELSECRICQEEDSVSNMETPCTCKGTLMYAHRKCVQQWCNEKGDISCEICHQPYQPGYTASPRPQFEATTIDIGRGGWQISGTPFDLRDPRILAIIDAERQLLEADYNDSDTVNSSGAVFFRSFALVLMALLLFRHAFALSDYEDEDNGSTLFIFFLLRTICFILPCYIIAWAISILHHRRERQEAAALAATQFANVLQSGQVRVLQFTLPPAPSPTPHQEHV